MFNKEKPVEVVIDKQRCSKCGLCVEACSSYLKRDEEGFPTARALDDKENIMGCIQCGNCMMLCPNDAIEVKGEDIDREHLRDINKSSTDFDSLNALFVKRRSCRKFKEDEIPKDIIEKIINAAATSAVSIPPSEVKVLVINGRDKVATLKNDLISSLEKFTKFMNPFAMVIMRLIAGKAQHKMFKEFVIPLSKVLIDYDKKGIDYLFYDAPAVVIFYGSEDTDKEDWMIASTQATLAAETLGLGSCFIGTVGAMFHNNPKLRKKYGFLKTDKLGMAFILGYPEIKYRKGFQRKFKEVRYW